MLVQEVGSCTVLTTATATAAICALRKVHHDGWGVVQKVMYQDTVALELQKYSARQDACRDNRSCDKRPIEKISVLVHETSCNSTTKLIHVQACTVLYSTVPAYRNMLDAFGESNPQLATNREVF